MVMVGACHDLDLLVEIPAPPPEHVRRRHYLNQLMNPSKLLVALALAGGLGLWPANRESAQVFTNLHSLVFTNGTTPYASLIMAGNALYGTAENYGGDGNCGSVFKLTTDGSSFTNLHTFDQGYDGGNPYGGLVLAGSMLCGTTVFGGISNFGCIFAINTNGTGLTNLFSFPRLNFSAFPYTNQNGAYPDKTLILSGSTLYGTTQQGGVNGSGVVFAVNTNGSGFTNLHSFIFSEGSYPGTLLLAGSTLYGAASSGGSSGYGSLFKLDTDGSNFTNFYNFTPKDYAAQTNTDGAFPLCNLVLSGSSLFGTTGEGGYWDDGTIFKIDTNGMNFSVLHHFSATNGTGINSDGARPQAGLILWSNVLYGTAEYGGNSGYGTVFSVKTDGTEFTTLYSFMATNTITGTNADGAYPLGSLLRSGSVLYGTASTGGAAGYGTVFSILFPPPLSIAQANTNVVLSWPVDATGFNLQSTTNLATPVWIGVTGQYVVTNPISGGQEFYRLQHP